MNEQGKDLFQSKVTWGVLIAVLDQVLSFYGIQLSDYVNIGVVTNAIPETIASLLVLYGNVSRKTLITKIAGFALSKGAK